MGDRPTHAGPNRDPRAGVIAPVRVRYPSILDFAETQSMNISRSGMFIATGEVIQLRSVIEFELALADGFALLKGSAEVVRVSANPAGLGLKFLQLHGGSQALIDRIVEVNALEGKRPTVGPEFTDPASVEASDIAAPNTASSDGVLFSGRTLRLQVSPVTAGYFLHNPLLNIRLGGFVVPGIEDVPLGTFYEVTVLSFEGKTLFAGKGKVVAKHEKRLGIRLVDVDKTTLATVQAEVNKIVPPAPPRRVR